MVILTENEDAPHSSSSIIESIEYWESEIASVNTGVSIVGSSNSSVPSLPVAILKSKKLAMFKI